MCFVLKSTSSFTILLYSFTPSAPTCFKQTLSNAVNLYAL
uniref:Uncharacterized protein n=1 Tax=Myoviridae sp. ctguh8 TaxID=2826682 RepID=A0A8S5MEQ1_9CAUD|nr:MAG TPA: hypothetical protein [Myoviridae sp. ctguh8]